MNVNEYICYKPASPPLWGETHGGLNLEGQNV